LLLIADALGVLGIFDEIVGELFLLADRPLDRPQVGLDLHLPLDAAFVFAFE